MTIKTKSLLALVAVAAFALLDAMGPAAAQMTSSTNDDTQLLISQIQTDKRAIVLKTLNLTDTETQKFTLIYDEYQKDRKALYERGADLINKYASNYDSMTDAAAKSILKDFFSLQDDRNALVKKYAKRFADVLPQTKVLRWVQVENKLNALMDFQGARAVPLAR